MSNWDRCLLCGRIMRMAAEDGVCASCQCEVDQMDAERAKAYVRAMLNEDSPVE